MACGTTDRYLYYCVGIGPWPEVLGDHIYKYDGTNPPAEIAWHAPFYNDLGERVLGLYYSPVVLRKLLILTGAYVELTPGNWTTGSRVYALDPSDDSVTLLADWYNICDVPAEGFYGGNWVTSATEWKGKILLGNSGGTYIGAIGVLDIATGFVTQVYHCGTDLCESDYNNITGFGHTANYVYFVTQWIVRSSDGLTWNFFYKTGPHDYFPPCDPEPGEHGSEDNFEFPGGVSQYDNNCFYFCGDLYQSTNPAGPNAKSIYKIENDVLIRCNVDDRGLVYNPGGDTVVSFDTYGNPTAVSYLSRGGDAGNPETIRLWDSLDNGSSWTRYDTPIDLDGLTLFNMNFGAKFFNNELYIIASDRGPEYPLYSVKVFKRTGANTWAEQWNYDAYDYDTYYTMCLGNAKMEVVSDLTPLSYCPPLPEMMQARYMVNVFDTSGHRTAILDNLKDIQIEHILNSYSTHIVSFDGKDIRKDLFGLDYFVEVRRKLYNSSWYTEYIGFHRTTQRQITEGRHRVFTSYGRGFLDLVNRRCIMYPATTPYTLKGGPGETVIKSYVSENAGTLANNPVRWNPNGSIGLGIEPDLAQGLYYAGQNTGKNLLEVIQEISSITSVDFDVIWIEGTGNFVFRTYYPIRGTDRRIIMAFDPMLGNMVQPSYTYSRTEEGTVCVVLGSGQGLTRRHLVRQGITIYDSPWNSIEIAKDARNTDSVASYISSGDEALADAAPKESFTFEVLQTAASQYGRDYFVGDIVTIRFDDIERIKKITGASIQMKEGKETIRLEFSDLPLYR